MFKKVLIMAAVLVVLFVAYFAKAQTVYYIWMHHYGDFVKFHTDGGQEIEIGAGKCSDLKLEHNGQLVSNGNIPKGSSISFPLAAGEHLFVVKSGKANIHFPEDAKDIKARHCGEKPDRKCGGVNESRFPSACTQASNP